MSKPKKITYEQAKEKWPPSILPESTGYRAVVMDRMDGYNRAIADMEKYDNEELEHYSPSMVDVNKLSERIDKLEKVVIKNGDKIFMNTVGMYKTTINKDE